MAKKWFLKIYFVFSIYFVFLLSSCNHSPKQSLSSNYTHHQKLSKSDLYERLILPIDNAHNVIYLMIAMNESDGSSPFEISSQEQTNINGFLRKKNLHNKELTQPELFNLLLDVEIKIRTIIKQRPNLMRSVIYVGQAKNFLQRALAHRADVLNTTKQIQSTKVRWLHGVLKRHYVRLTYLLNDIPPAYLSIFECLIGHLFSVQEFKGSAQLGTTKAWEELKLYFKTRKRLHALEALGLSDSMEQDREKLRELILPFQSPWH